MGGRTAVARPTFSERRFHRWLSETLRPTPVGPLPIGDDTAAVPLGGHRVGLLTTDALTEGTHFLRTSPPRSIGHAVASVSLSDVAAKGGRPTAFLLDLLLPSDTPEPWARAVTAGAEERLREFGAHLVGGDTKPSGTRSVVGTLLAIGDRRRLSPRSGARPGDVLVTTGSVGAGGVAAQRLRPGRLPSRAALTRLLEVSPRVEEGLRLSRWTHAMMDTSDGLAESARLVSEASRCRLVLETAAIPLHPGLLGRSSPRGDPLRRAFYGGDYELFAALRPTDVERARRTVARIGTSLTVIGRVEKGRGAWLEEDGARIPMPAAGWQPFGERPRDL